MPRFLPARLALPLALSLGLFTACSRDGSQSTPALDGAAMTRAAQGISQPAWLRERLPQHTVAYLRIPTLWGWLSAPNGRALDHALASQVHVDVIAQLRAAVRKDPLIADSAAGPMLGLLLADPASPVEIAMVDGSDIANPTSRFFATVQLDVADSTALNTRLAALSPDKPLLKAPLDAQGRGELASGGFVRFDAATRRLFLQAGMAASASALDALIQETTQTRPPEMAASEREVDASGQGLFFWLKLKGINGMTSGYLPQDAHAALLRDFVQKSDSLAAGWGTVDGHGHLQIRLRAPAARLLAHVAPKAAPPPLKTAGKPQWAASMSLPDAAQWQGIIDQLDADFGPGTRARFDTAMASLGKTLGADPLALVRKIGPAMVSFEDDAGAYTALQVSDRPGLYALIDSLGPQHGWQHSVLQIGKVPVHHLHIPHAAPGKASLAGADAAQAAAESLYGRIGTHLYWVEDGDWLIFASVPQALADRAAASPKNEIARWQQAQGYPAASSLFGLSATTRNVQRMSYYAYLSSLQMAADLLGTTIALEKLPSASALALPTQGATGLSLQATQDFVGLDLQYDVTPADSLVGGGSTMTTIATTAILAAIALPAYEDYVSRSQVVSVLDATQPLQSYVADHWTARGEFPDEFDDSVLDSAELATASQYLGDFWLDDGAIVLQFGDQAASALKDHTLVLTPHRQGKHIVWRCAEGAIADHAHPLSAPGETTTVPDKLLPARCK